MSDINFAEPTKRQKPVYANPLLWLLVLLAIAVIVVVVIVIQQSTSGASESSSSSASVQLVDSNGKKGEEYFTDEEIRAAAEIYGMDEQQMRDKINELNALITDEDIAKLVEDGSSVDAARSELISLAILSNLAPTKDDSMRFETEAVILQPGIGVDVGDRLFVSVEFADKDDTYKIKYDNGGKTSRKFELGQWVAFDKNKGELKVVAEDTFDGSVDSGEAVERIVKIDGNAAFLQFIGTDASNTYLWQVDGK